MARKLISKKIVNNSGINMPNGKFEILKQQNFIALTDSVGGDAPKDVIRVYEYGKGKPRKDNPKKWTKHIAKIGHKWYPNESITEHYLTHIGKAFGIKIANSKIVIAENYIRFLSEHFHTDEQELIHGANILSRFIRESNNDWIDKMDKDKSLRGEVNITDVKNAIVDVFPNKNKNIIDNLVHMILFDALIGNNDRHYYNWGVIKHIKNKHDPYFSPIYDTARGLFWNYNDNFIVDLYKKQNDANNKKLEKYVNKSSPKISSPENANCNHFELIEFLKNNNYIGNNHQKIWSNKESLQKATLVLNTEFKNLFIKERRVLIEKVLNLRFNKLVQILEN